MPFTLIAGTFHVTGYSPDGDSIRFRPDNLDLLKGLPGGRLDVNARGHAQLRIEAIDTLETHFTPQGGSGTFHQPTKLAHDAVEALLAFVDIKDVRWTADRRTVASAKDGTRGYILSREVEKFGRPVSFLFAGTPPETDGSSVMLRVDRLQDSYNLSAIKAGLAYATYYTGLFADLRSALTEAAQAARTAGRGVYAADATNAGFEVETIADITDRYVILPKLFRRLSEFISKTGSAVGFKEALAEAEEPVLDLRTANFTHFDTFVEQQDGSARIALLRSPEELVFGPMKERVASPFSQVLLERASLATGMPTEQLLA